MQLFLLRTHTVSASSKAPNDLCCHPGLHRVNICQGWWAEGTLTPGGRAGFCFMWEEDCSTQVQTWMFVMWVVCTSMLVCVTGPVLWRVLGFVLCSPFPPCLHTWSFSPLVLLSFSLLCSVMVPVDAAEPGSAAYSPSSENLLLPAVQISVSTKLIYATQLIVGGMIVISPVHWVTWCWNKRWSRHHWPCYKSL